MKPLKKGSFLDPILNVDRKKYPAAAHYELIKKWPESKPKNPKVLKPLKRNTYIE